MRRPSTFLEEEETHDRTGQHVVCPQRGAMPQQFIIGDDEAELKLLLGSRSFLVWLNDQVRKRQKRSSMKLESALFMGMNYSDNQHSIKNTKDRKMKQMFDISEKMVSEQDEIYGVKTIDWEDYSWKYLSLIGDEQVISFQRTEVYVFSDSVLCLW